MQESQEEQMGTEGTEEVEGTGLVEENSHEDKPATTLKGEERPAPKPRWDSGILTRELNPYLEQPVVIQAPPIQVARPPKKSPLELSDEEIAEKDPEDLEKVRRVYSNYREIKQSQREVKAMEQQDMFEERVAEVIQAHNLPRDAAVILVKKEFGIEDRPAAGYGGGGGFGSQMRDFALAVKAIQEIGTVFSPQGGKSAPPPSSANQNNAFFKAAQLAATRATPTVLYGPDGQIIEFPGTGGQPQSLPEQVGEVTHTITSLMKASEELKQGLGIGGNGAVLNPQTAQGMDPELLKVYLDFQAKGEERKTQTEIAKMRSESTGALTNLLLTALQPGGLDKLRSIYSAVQGNRGDSPETRGKGKSAGETPDSSPPPVDTNFNANCVECGQQVEVTYGQPNFTCPNCQAVCELIW